MNSCRTHGLILNVSDYSESDKLVTFYSPDLGRATGIAKGAKRSKQRFVNKLEVFSLLHILYRPAKRDSLLFLVEADLEHSFLTLRQHYDRYVCAIYIGELVMRFTREQDPDPSIFSLLTWAMQALEDSIRPLKVATLFHLRILGAAGYQPEIDRCGICGKSVQPRLQYTLHPSNGSLACNRCGVTDSDSLFSLSVQTLKFLDYAQRIELKNIGRLKIPEKNIDEALTILYRYTQHLLQHDIHSWNQLMALRTTY